MRSKGAAAVWLLAVLAVAAWLTLRLLGGPPPINSDLMDLLPEGERDPVVDSAMERVQKRFERQIVMLVGAPDPSEARALAEDLAGRLRASGQFRQLRLRHEGDMVERIARFYLPLRFQLLSESARGQLLAGRTGGFENDILRRYFDPAGRVDSRLIGRDPLLLLPGYLEERAGLVLEQIRLEQGYFVIRSAERTHVALFGELKTSPFSFTLQERLAQVLEDFRAELAAGGDRGSLLMAGLLPHALAGTASAIQEMSSVGLGSLVATLLLLLLVFRSWRPFGLSLIAIAVGCLGGFAACLLVFGQVHLLTLVFGSSLVGISVDYSLHFFCERFRFVADWSPRAALRHIFPGITLGLITSLIGFLGLLVAPFPGMREMAVFSGVGLCFAYGCVVAWYPELSRNLGRAPLQGALALAQAYGTLWQRGPGWALWLVPLGLGLAGLAGLAWLDTADDVRLLQTPSAAVLAEEQATRGLIGRNLASQFFLVEGRDEADYLRQDERLTLALQDLRAKGRLEGYLAISDFIPSPQRQEENRRLLDPIISSLPASLARLNGTIGLPEGGWQRYGAEFAAARARPPVMLSQWLDDPVSEPYRHLWIGESPRGVVGIVGLRGVFDLPALRELGAAEPRWHFVDPAGEISALLGRYRVQTIWLTLASYLLVTALVLYRYGLGGGLAVMAAPLAAALATLGILGLAGEAISLFNVMALLLVLGIGVDYSLFFRETGTETPTTLLAIALSAFTTLLAFGLLSLSATWAIHGFGITVMIGISLAFLLSPLAGRLRRSPPGPSAGKGG